ncbi:MAG: ATPase domain-containing protein [Terriglobales bacterium]
MSEGGLIKTGIRGLDTILLGGIPRTNVILLQGVTGSGKTLMGVEFIYRGIALYGEPGLIVVFETSPEKLIRDAAEFGWDLNEMQEQRKLQIIFTSPQVFEQELRSPSSLLLETAEEIRAQRIFVDGIGLLDPALSVIDAPRGAFRELLQQLIESSNRENLTTMFSIESGCASCSVSTVEATDFLADTVIQLNRERRDRRVRRSLEIVKSRGQDYEPGEHTLRITGGHGLEVFRRVQAPLRPCSVQQPTSSAKRSVIGVEAVDTLIGGGIFDGSTTMVVGVSGVGKTVLGTQILREGALKQGTRGLLVSLDEHPAQIIRNAQTLGLNLEEQIADGTIQIMFESPQELDIDAHYARIVQLIEERDVQRMVIDGMTSYSTAIGETGVYRDFFHAIVAYSKQRLMTTFFNYENPEFLGISSYMPDFPVSSIVDNLILMSLVEINNSLHRCMSVVKARGSKHSFETREFEIGPGGISLIPLEKDLDQALPLQSYSSLLSRAPTRLSLPKKMNGPTAIQDRQ